MKTNEILFYVYFSNFGNVFWWRASVFCPHGLSACIYCNYSFILWNKKDVCKQLFLIIFRCSVVILKVRKTASCVFNIITSSKPLVWLHSPKFWIFFACNWFCSWFSCFFKKRHWPKWDKLNKIYHNITTTTITGNNNNKNMCNSNVQHLFGACQASW